MDAAKGRRRFGLKKGCYRREEALLGILRGCRRRKKEGGSWVNTGCNMFIYLISSTINLLLVHMYTYIR